MNVVLYMSIFWLAYGIVGILGFQVAIPKNFREQKWTKEYTRKQGLSWLILGNPWFVYYLLCHNNGLEFPYELIVLIACSLPSLIFTFITDKKYKALLKR